MDELFSPPIAGATPGTELFVATIATSTSAGITLNLPGAAAPTVKAYKQLVTGKSLFPGDRVLVAKLSGTMVVLGRIAY